MTIYKYEKSVRNCGMSHDQWLCMVRDITDKRTEDLGELSEGIVVDQAVIGDSGIRLGWAR